MIKGSPQMEEFEREYARERAARRDFEEALAVFEGLWAHARALGHEFPGDWEKDIEADLVLARVLNGLPPAS